MTLFTKRNCQKCEFVKGQVDLGKAGVVIWELSNDNYEALAELAWYELVSVAEKTMPILVLDDNTSITGAIRIKNYLLKAIEGSEATN